MRHFLIPIILSGFSAIWAFEARAANTGAPDGDRVETVTTEGLTARGVLVPGQTADIAAGMSGKLLSAPYKAGRYVKTGAEIARFDCTRQEADLTVREQAHLTQSLKYDNQNELLQMGAAGALDVQIAKSERDQLSAEIKAIQVALRDCVVNAPFAGYISVRHVNAYESPQAGQPLYSMIRAGSTELSVIAPSNWVRWMTPGMTFDFKVDETNDTFTAKVIRLSAAVDPVSQTIEVTAKPTSRTKAKPGMSGVAYFKSPKPK